MLTFCQQNYPQKLGTSNFSIARYGCLTVDITVGYDWFFGKSTTPPEIASILDYNQDGLLLWGSLNKIGLQLKNRAYNRNDSDIVSAIKDPNEICVLQVNNNHWVMALGKNIFGGYRIFDPWFGDYSTTARYKQNITGYAIISKI